MSKTVAFDIDDAMEEKLKYLAIITERTVNSLIVDAIIKLLNCNGKKLNGVTVRNGKTKTVRIPDELLEKLDNFAMKHGMNRSEAIRLAITKLLNKYNIDNQVVPKARVGKIKIR